MMRVHELAKKLNMGNKELIAELQELGVDVKSALNSVDDETAAHIIELFHPLINQQEEERKEVTRIEVVRKDKEELYGDKKKINIHPSCTVGALGEALGVKPNELIMVLINKGIMATINQSITKEITEVVEEVYNVEINIEYPEIGKISVTSDEGTDIEDKKKWKPRPPVVTIMGHVDHGKTKLIDAIRATNIVDKESGGITQHIGAYKVHLPHGDVTFLDTPGHEAFTAMRARGAHVTDVVVLVVAADDGVMPQTEEAINHAKAAGVPILVAINKIDLPNANPERVKSQLVEYGLQPEEWGGNVICVEISAKKKIGLEHLLEMLLLEAEMLELKAPYDCKAQGVIIEAKLDKGKGPVGTVLIQKGTLKVGDVFVAGVSYGKVRAMFNDRGERVKKATPSTPVEVLGFSEVPVPGDMFKVVKNEKQAKQIINQRKESIKAGMMDKHKISLEEVYSQVQEGVIKELSVILKADVTGSLEAMLDSLRKIGTKEVKIKVIHKGIGDINESDVMLASASNAIIIGFHVGIDSSTKKLAEEEGIDVRNYTVIYELIEELTEALEGLLEPKYKEVTLGIAEVKEIFRASKIGIAAGSVVKEGKVVKNARVRVKRAGEIIADSKIISLRRFKDDVIEVVKGLECGIGIEGVKDIKPNDILEVYTVEKVDRGKVVSKT
jgi:translation initiation factor IF-2